MRKEVRKIISIFLLVALIVTDNNFIAAAERVLAVSTETATITENLSAATISEATPIKERSPKVTLEATPSEATPSEATPSEATPSEAKEIFIRMRPEEKPAWYKKTGKIYEFKDRDGIIQYRIYGKIGEEGEEGWYQSDESGALIEDATFTQPIDLDWEDNCEAPYRFESALASRATFMELSEMLFNDEKAIFQYESEVTTKRPFGKNYDGSYYDVWHLYSNLGEGMLLEEQKKFDAYYMYGHVINTYNSDLYQNKWFKVSKDGKVIVEEFQITPHMATPSMAAHSDIPMYYKKTDNNGIWNFTDRYGQIQYRIFLNLEWYECDSNGDFDENEEAIDLNWEYYNEAPYIYDSEDISDDARKLLYDYGYDNYSLNMLNDQGSNWDGSSYNIAELDIHYDEPTFEYLIYATVRNKNNNKTEWLRCNKEGVVSGKLFTLDEDDVNNRIINMFQEKKLRVAVSDTSLISSTLMLQAMASSSPYYVECYLYTQSRWDAQNTHGAEYSSTIEINGNCTDRRYIVDFFHADTRFSKNTWFGIKNVNTGEWVYTFTFDSLYSYYSPKINYVSSEPNYNSILCALPEGYYRAVSVSGSNAYFDPTGSDAGYHSRLIHVKMNHTCSPRQTITVNPTCTTAGTVKREYGIDCGISYSGNVSYASLPALGHAYPASYTYKTDGYHYKYCTRCGGQLDKQPNIYYVSYNGNGATVGSTATSTYTYAAGKALNSNGYNRKYYTFNGWNTKADGTGISYNNGQTVANLTGTNGATVTLYAQWKRIVYTVTFADYDGRIIENKTVNAGDAVTPPTDPVRFGYTFTGWTKSLNEVTTDFTATAKYSVNSYTIFYVSEVNQPSDVSTQLFTSLQTYNSALGTLPEPIEKGYTFIGWFDGDNKISPETVFSPTANPQNYVYNARWKVNNYHIRFLGNHYKLDQVILEQDRDYYNKIGDLPELQIPGYTFMGWFDKNYNEITSESWVEPENIDYAAHWEANRYNIHFNSNLYAIEKDPEDKIVTYDDVIGELPILKTDGYTFLGWFTDPEAGEEITESTPVAIGDQTYYAHWTKNTYFMKFITDMASNLIEEISVVYDQVVGKLHVPKLEDFSFRGWYLSPYTATSSEAIYLDSATPSEALRIDENTIYKIATSSEAYAYFDLVFREEDGNKNRRCGKDGILGNDDDNFYFNGEDKIAGTSDDRKIFKGLDGEYGSTDDYYEYDGYYVYPGKDGIFGTPDDFVDLQNGTNLRAQNSDWWDKGALLVNNGSNMSPGTKYDWIWENQAANTIRRAGEDFIFFTEDDEIWWIGSDGIPGNDDDKLINKGMDGQYGTSDDFIDNGDDTNTRPGPDLIWGTEDDEIWWNGPDGIPGNEDDKLIHKGMDGQYGTIDDFIDNGDGTNTRPGPDLKWGTEDDEIWLNGPDDIPGNEDDKLKVDEKNNIGNTPITQQVTVLPMYPSIINNNNNDKGDDDDKTYKDILLQASTLKQSNYEGLGGDEFEDIVTSLPVESIATLKVAETISPLNSEDDGNNNKTFWSELLNWISELFNWIKENKKDVLAVFLLFLILLAVLYEGSRRKNKGKLPLCHNIGKYKTKLFKKRLHNNRT